MLFNITSSFSLSPAIVFPNTTCPPVNGSSNWDENEFLGNWNNLAESPIIFVPNSAKIRIKKLKLKKSNAIFSHGH